MNKTLSFLHPVHLFAQEGSNLWTQQTISDPQLWTNPTKINNSAYIIYQLSYSLMMVRTCVIKFLVLCHLILSQVTECLLFDIRLTTLISKQISNMPSQMISKTTHQLDTCNSVQHIRAYDLHDLDFHSKFLGNLQFITTNKIIK